MRSRTKDNMIVEFDWNEDDRPATNYANLGEALAEKGDLFRNADQGGGLTLIAPESRHRAITKGSELYPVIVDRVHVQVWKGGRKKGGELLRRT